jgi:hypothetical protein
MAHNAERPLPYAEFKQLVRHYPRTPLLRAVAAQSAALELTPHRERHLRTPSAVTTSSLAGVARTCIRGSNEFRDAAVTAETVAMLCNQFVQIDDPDIVADDCVDISRLIAKIMHEQAPAQYSQLENLGRTLSVLLDHRDGVTGAPTDDEWRSLLGVDLQQYMRIGFATLAAVINHGGSITREILTSQDYGAIFGTTAVADAAAVLDRHFIGDLKTLQAQCATQEAAFRGREKWTFNPLSDRPLINIDGDLVAPVPHYLIEKITTTGLYYVAAHTWGNTFTTALGAMFERYVGTQLDLLGVPVHPEIVYGSPERRTCDYVAVFDDVVLLVEAKSARPTLDVRMGNDGAEEELEHKIGHARKQLMTTAAMISAEHAAVAHIPKDRPMVGLVVTLEPFHLGRTMRADALLTNDVLPIGSACAHDLEGTVAALAGRPDAGQRLLSVLADDEPDFRELRRAIEGVTAPESAAPRNSVVDQAYARWIDGTAGAEELRKRADRASA